MPAQDDRYRTLLRQAGDPILILDGAGDIVEANGAAAELLGSPEDELRGRGLAELLTGQPGRNGVDLDRFLVGPFTFRRSDGRAANLELSCSRVQAGGTFFLVIARDMTEWTRMHDGLQRTHRIEALGHLAGGVAHDFNNLLSIILGYVEIMLSDLPADSEHRGPLEAVQRAGSHGASLTRQLLAFSRHRVLETKVIDLNNQVIAAETLLARLMGENITIRLELDPALWPVEMDPDQVQQVLMNLAVNAQDAMPRGGQLSIGTANEPAAAAGAADRVLLSVRDTGCGMDAHTLERAFEPFFTTKSRDRGTGLGLSLVHGVVTQSGGTIGVTSQPDQGTCFSIHFPRCAPEPDRDADADPPGVEPGGGLTVLLVEDQLDVRELGRICLEKQGFHVLLAERAEIALGLAARYPGPIHLVLSDVVLPGLSGPDLLQRLKVIRPEARLMLMSGYTGDFAALREARQLGVPFMEKPFTQAKLIQHVTAALRGRRR